MSICKICLEEDIKENLISPCLCSGNIKYVHKICIDNWRNQNLNNNSYYSCEICKEIFILQLNENYYKTERKIKIIMGLEIFFFLTVILTLIFLLGKVINFFTNFEMILVNNEFINDLLLGIIIIIISSLTIGYFFIIYSNRGNFLLFNNNLHRQLDIFFSNKVVLVIMSFIGFCILAYYIIKLFILFRKKYFDKKYNNTNKYIIVSRQN